MKLIENNPYRVLGILASASIRDKTKTISRLKMLIEAEQNVTDDFSFPVLGNLERTIDNVERAASSLDLDKDKLRASIFWFCNGSHTDEPAFDSLKEGNTDVAIRIWTKLTHSKMVSKSNSSAFLNLSTLNLWNAFNNGTIESNLLREGIALKLKFFESDFFTELVKLSTDEKYRISRVELEEIFLKDVYEQVVRFGNGYESEFWNSLRDIDFSAKSLFEKHVIQVIVDKIEKHINNSKDERKEDVTKSIEIGNKLIDNTNDELENVKKILGENNPKYTTLSDKISNEAAQCAIVYFNHFREKDFDPGEAAEALILRARKYAVGRLTIDRLTDSGDTIKEWNTDRDNRIKYKSVSHLTDGIREELTRYESMRQVSASAVSLIENCKPILAEFGNEIGFDDNLYIQLSTTIAIVAQNYIIAEFNWLGEKLQEPKRTQNSLLGNIPSLFNVPLISREEARNILYNVHSAMLEVGILDMDRQYERENYEENKKQIEKICNMLNINTRSNYGIRKISATHKVKRKSDSFRITYPKTSQTETSWAIISIWILIILAILFMIYARYGK